MYRFRVGVMFIFSFFHFVPVESFARAEGQKAPASFSRGSKVEKP